MDPSQALSVGGLTQLEAVGQRSIMIFDPTPLPMSKPSKLFYYSGAVRSGSPDNLLSACDATIFKLNEEEHGPELYAKLTQVDHPCVIKALGFANGVEKDINCSYLALTPFKETFDTYSQKDIGADQNGRLTEDFITLINDIVDGLEELHSLGYYCPKLKCNCVAVIRQSGSISAKIWDFDRCDPGMEEEQKDKDWLSLGQLIYSVSTNKEVLNLLKKIRNGKLKGKSIMKDTALLTVRKKFENVLAFCRHISVHCQKKPNQSQNKNGNDLKASELCAANLEDDLDRRLPWTTPGWTQLRGHGLPISTKTLRGFVNQIRIFIEHEILYIPEEMTRSLTTKELLDGKKKQDLEHQLQDERCGKLFRAVQRLVAELKLEY